MKRLLITFLLLPAYALSCQLCIDEINDNINQLEVVLKYDMEASDVHCMNFEEVVFFRGIQKGFKDCKRILEQNHPK